MEFFHFGGENRTRLKNTQQAYTIVERQFRRAFKGRRRDGAICAQFRDLAHRTMIICMLCIA